MAAEYLWLVGAGIRSIRQSCRAEHRSRPRPHGQLAGFRGGRGSALAWSAPRPRDVFPRARNRSRRHSSHAVRRGGDVDGRGAVWSKAEAPLRAIHRLVGKIPNLIEDDRLRAEVPDRAQPWVDFRSISSDAIAANIPPV